MTYIEDFLGSKKFDYFIPNLLKDSEILTVLQSEFNTSKDEEEKFQGELRNEVHDFLEQYILEHAPEIEGVEVNLNEDPEETDYGIYTYVIRGMKGIFFTESADDDTHYFSEFKTARTSIELNHNVVLSDDGMVDESLGDRISKAETLILRDELLRPKKL